MPSRTGCLSEHSKMEKDKNEKQAERIPREQMHDQAERLTNKHIQTLGFLKDIASENKALKERVLELEDNLEGCKDLHNFAEESKAKIKEIQDAYLAKADEVTHMLTEKHRMELWQVNEEKVELERDLKEQLLKMRHEVDTLKAAHKDLRETAKEDEEGNETKAKLKELTKQNQDYKTENEELKEELGNVRSDLEIIQSKKTSDMTMIRELKTENKRLEETLQEVQQKANELEFRLDKALSELNEKNKNQEQANLVENLRDKVKQLLAEREASIERETQLKYDLLELQAIKDEIRQSNNYLQSELEKLLAEYGYLSVEYDKLHKQSLRDKDKKTFQDFVQLKRQLNSLKNENENLKSQTKPSGQLVLREELPPPPPPSLPRRKKNSLEGVRNGAKKMLAITVGNEK